MIMLVVGNGFDLAHGLPTKYKHFLDFIKMYKGEEVLSYDDEDIYNKLQMFVAELKTRTDNTAKEAKSIIEGYNRLLDHFLKVYLDRCKENKEGWIDFESEISYIVQLLDETYEYVRERERKGQDITLTNALYKRVAPFIFSSDDYPLDRIPDFQLDLIKEIARTYLIQLNKITRLFEIYLTDFVGKIQTNLRIPEICTRCKNVNAVLSFNYTDTYRRLYQKMDVECCFIHGKASNNCVSKNPNLVLGIDEYLGENRKDNDNLFIWFKKFYQRIYKETDSQYIDWINDDIEENKDKEEKLPLYIYFYGHSLDITDKDVLQKLIMYENAIVNIFYHNKEEMGKQISNLTKIIGEDSLIHMTNGRNRKITFIPASKARE